MSGSVLQESSVEYHAREAARFRRLAETATTPGIKQRLLMEAQEHDRLAGGMPPPEMTSSEWL